MAELNKIRFLLLVSLMIYPARALDVILSGAHQNFKQKSEISIGTIDGEKIYRGTCNQLTYEAELGISKVIVYIISKSRCIEILRPDGLARETRSQIAWELRRLRYELVFLGIENFDDDEYHLIGAFLLEKIRSQPGVPDVIIETIGEGRFDHFYGCHVLDFEKHEENAQTLLARLRSIPHGARRPVGSNDKEIKLWGYQPFVREVKWPVCVENNTYVPNVSASDPTYNFWTKYPNQKISILILSGKEYSVVTSFKHRSWKRLATKDFLSGMIVNYEVLVILGAFNFDWTEIDIVTQIILKHSEGWQSSGYNVFTCGYGMFNTYYQNEYNDDERCIQQQPSSYVSDVIKVLMDGEEVKQRALDVYYKCEHDWKIWNVSIILSNGRYVPEERYKNCTIPCLHQKIAFIVYDQTEMNVQIDYFLVRQSAEELEQSGISVVLIEALNFGLDDMHIIAQWIDCHSGIINMEQIAVLGGGIFDTIFQSKSTTYNTFLNTKKNVLETIRNAYVRSGNAKRVSAASIDQFPKLEIWSYPMNAVVNGFYEPDLIPDKNMLNNTSGIKPFFIITSAYNFQQIAAMGNLETVAASFRKSIRQYYPHWIWNIYLVGLDNFEERDSHLFAELVNRQTKDGKSFGKFVRTLNSGISQAIYQYKDTAPFDVENRSIIHDNFLYYFWDRNAD